MERAGTRYSSSAGKACQSSWRVVDWFSGQKVLAKKAGRLVPGERGVTMSSTSEKNQDGNYFIGDHENVTEMARLLRQDGMLTEGMGGLLAEREQEASAIHSLLDLACGPGGWV